MANRVVLTALLFFGFYASFAQLSGAYTIGGTSPNYTTIQSAIDSLKIKGLSGHVVFNIRQGTYNERVLFDDISATSPTKTITIQSDPNNTGNVVLAYVGNTVATYNSTIELKKTSYVNIYGLNFLTDTSSSKTILFTTPLKNVEIKNCYFDTKERLSTQWFKQDVKNCHIGIRRSNAAGDTLFNVTIDSNEFHMAKHSIHLDISSPRNLLKANMNRFISITGNKFVDFANEAIFITNADEMTFEGNTFNGRTIGTPTLIIPDWQAGIYMDDCGSFIAQNNIIKTRASWDRGVYSFKNRSSKPSYVLNNSIALLGAGYAIQISHSVPITTDTLLYVQHNSAHSLVVKNKSHPPNLYQLQNAGITVIQNNIFSHPKHSFVNRIGFNTTAVENHNIFYSENIINNPSLPTIFDSTSIITNPMFLNDSILIPQNFDLDSAGVFISSLPIDLAGVTRNTSAPDIGAYEFVGHYNDAGIVEIKDSVFCTGLNEVKVTVKNFADNRLRSFMMDFQVSSNNGPYVSTIVGPIQTNIPSGQQAEVSFSYVFSSLTNLKLRAISFSPNSVLDTNRSNDTSLIRTVTTLHSQPIMTWGPLNSICLSNKKVILPSATAIPSGGVYTISGQYFDGTHFRTDSSGIGNFSLTNIYVDTNGCSDTATNTIRVDSVIPAKISVINDFCDNAVSFKLNVGSPSGGYYVVDTIIDSLYRPVLLDTGKHEVKYITTTTQGCSDTAYQETYIKKLPGSKFVLGGIFCGNTENYDITHMAEPKGGTYFGKSIVNNRFTSRYVGLDSIFYFSPIINGCYDTIMMVANVKSPPVVTLRAIDKICVGDSIHVFTEGNWHGKRGKYKLNGQYVTAFNPNITISDSLVHIYTQTDFCTDSAKTPFIVGPHINFTSDANIRICQTTDSLEFNYVRPLGGKYNGIGQFGTKFYTKNIKPGAHTMTYHLNNEFNCFDSTQFSITIDSFLRVSAIDTSICFRHGKVSLPFLSPIGGTLFGNHTIGNEFYVTGSGTGTFIYGYGYETNKYCSDTVYKTITVDSIPIVDLGSDQITCGDQQAQFNFRYPNYSVLWQDGSKGSSYSVSRKSETVKVKITDAHGCVGEDDAMVIFDGNCAGVDESEMLKENHVSVFPNPVFDQITISWSEHHTPSELLVISSVGAHVYNVNISNPQKGEYNLDLSRLSSGSYFIKLVHSSGVENFTIIKE